MCSSSASTAAAVLSGHLKDFGYTFGGKALPSGEDATTPARLAAFRANGMWCYANNRVALSRSARVLP